MLYPEWAELSSDDQAAAVSVQNLGHALTHIRRAIPEGQPSRTPELAEAWKAIDKSVANGGVSDPDGYITNVRAWSVRVGRVKDADYSEARERCQWAIKLAGKFVPAKPAASQQHRCVSIKAPASRRSHDLRSSVRLLSDGLSKP
jgi:hypothetical protein